MKHRSSLHWSEPKGEGETQESDAEWKKNRVRLTTDTAMQI